MIKRRFYKVEHTAHDGSSSSSSSESEDEVEEREEETQGEEEDDEKEVSVDEWRNRFSSDGSSGYDSEDSSGNEISCDSTGNIEKDDALDQNESRFNELDDCILKQKSVFKCRICPRIVCLSESTLLAHVNSKRHARSKKLLEEGRLKLMLNSDGEIEEDLETHAERHARTIALAKNSEAPKKKKRGRQRQRERKKAKLNTSRDVGGQVRKRKQEKNAKGPK